MRARREGRGARGAPDPAPALLETWRSVIETLGGGSKLVLGGKSLGGRIASLLCDEAGARGLVCLGYPFHPPGRPERLRVTHLAGLQTPALIVQGTRDTLGDREEVPAYELSPKIRLAWIEDGDHSLRPRKSSGRTEEQNLAQAVEVVARFVNDLPR
jgi:hypothetical protein